MGLAFSFLITKKIDLLDLLGDVEEASPLSSQDRMQRPSKYIANTYHDTTC